MSASAMGTAEASGLPPGKCDARITGPSRRPGDGVRRSPRQAVLLPVAAEQRYFLDQVSTVKCAFGGDAFSHGEKLLRVPGGGEAGPWLKVSMLGATP